ncbi:hypothetical protein LOK49_LG06G01665 [Camellia lanceoleosa]|uniref:Uncharacterized protein n=1 Tax=Camellia lanceoleosa TaxID=1840588 RepID=A0ACC0H956_9ERIC|nr:hypothetical protein LOK49_LG06G01665 [Camellia lanceoleosa]
MAAEKEPKEEAAIAIVKAPAAVPAEVEVENPYTPINPKLSPCGHTTELGSIACDDLTELGSVKEGWLSDNPHILTHPHRLRHPLSRPCQTLSRPHPRLVPRHRPGFSGSQDLKWIFVDLLSSRRSNS